ncbi:MAG: aminotransferase class V-fold PLP-dependent enzyme [Candidatus Marinimicrobia bacterium]|mgnify:CR=1 FL=1|jgi:isopenicillin-N epimerase|nr:aminotransferase class V-fold PLP-dependent enzyme [Candidatus Neomarinimicrobiota bacterium]MBT4362544.1 aminotransferase class V-fold PLP-dependent enzyme [Candidatus Neomarinimicrobiota bacterium]MBT4714883.1 aminotransferase class V-fold PLP-dependent enzyme [Candidatus Neomarinimicrobiota bacterium]MBT4947329.1 aminotransferase class V-fold PLP-dependent enzyme [Candidatus Neomarinimicrobiota bacterium]MBT5269470.1 aminotransferase class V-fold PLP-dependent enzyme [Candidatus Neomarini
MLANIRSEFLLDPDIHYLNHGSFGACPREVFRDYQNWQRILERNPIDYYTRQLKGLFGKKASGPLEEARTALADFVNADAAGMIFTPNVTVALNAIANSIKLQADDEVLATDHEYGTIVATWARKCTQNDAILKEVEIDLPVSTQAEFVDYFWKQVTPNTKVIVMSHITSATALVLPVKEICQRARKAGIITVIDGAHAVGQIDLDLENIDADFYTSNCHKWLLTPKGTAFLHVHATQRAAFEPLVISWAEINQPSFSLRHEMWGTRDMAAFLCIPAALRFREKHNWKTRHREARALLYEFRDKFSIEFDRETICDQSWLAQIAGVLLPAETKLFELWQYLWEEHRIEAMITRWREEPIIRLSYNAYNTPDELDLLLQAIRQYQNL